MRILVCGNREWKDWLLIWTVLDGYYTNDAVGWLTITALPFVVIEGGATGADTCASEWVYKSPLHGEVVNLGTYDPVKYEDKHSGMPVAHLCFPAEWNKYGNAAGPIRNGQMLREGKPDLVLAFGYGRGTDDMVTQARNAMLPVVRIVKEL